MPIALGRNGQAFLFVPRYAWPFNQVNLTFVILFYRKNVFQYGNKLENLTSVYPKL